MSLRFFRKKADDKEPANDASDTSETKKPARRRSRRSSTKASETSSGAEAKTTTRSRAGRSSTAKSRATTKASESKSSTSTTKASNGRRRGRRGGAGRSKSTTTKADEPAVVETPTTGEPAKIEAALHELAVQQVSTLKGLQGSLSAIESRLASGGGRASSLAERPRIGIFVDVPNIMYAAERERVTLDYGRVLDFIVGNRELVRASAYAPISDDPEEDLGTQKFVQPFMDLGYRIVTKPLKRYANGSIKANFDVELAIDVLTMSDRLDIVVLMSGDGDFRRLVEIVASKGVRVEVVAFGQSTASELRTVADEYIDLSEHLTALRVAR